MTDKKRTRIVVVDGIQWKLISGITLPGRSGGRKKAINNDDHLVFKALLGLEKGKYKSCRDAAIKLAPLARTLIDDKLKKTAGTDRVVDRLRHKIAKARNRIS